MSDDEARRARFREMARDEIRRNPPPPASPALQARIAAIFASASTPDMTAPGLGNPGATDTDPQGNGRKSDDHRTAAA